MCMAGLMLRGEENEYSFYTGKNHTRFPWTVSLSQCFAKSKHRLFITDLIFNRIFLSTFE